MTISGDYYYHPPPSYEMELLDCPPLVKEIVSRSLTKWRYNTFTERELREQDRRKTPIDGVQKRHRTRIETIRSYMLGCMPAWSAYIQRYPVLDFIDYTLRGSGQVIFCNNSITGLFILVSLFIGDPWIACCSLCGLLSATIMALFLNFNKGAIRAGLFGFNGVLVGAALGTFLANGSWSGTTIAAIIVMGMFSTILAAAIANFNGTFKLPTFTLPFNLCAIVFMLGVYQFYHFEMIPGISGSIAIAHDVSPIQSYLSSDLIVAVFKGVSQVWLINNTASGVVIIVGMLFCSPLSSFFAFLGSSIGLIVGLSLGVNVQDAMIGLWGYNAVLSCVALGGVFYILCIKQFVLCVFGGILCTILLGTFKGLFATLGMPAFTFPFCLGTIVFILIQNSLPDVIALPLPSITTPEQHLKLKKIIERAIQRMRNNANIKRERKTQQINIIIITDKEIETPVSGIKEKTTSPLDLPVVAMAP